MAGINKSIKINSVDVAASKFSSASERPLVERWLKYGSNDFWEIIWNLIIGIFNLYSGMRAREAVNGLDLLQRLSDDSSKADLLQKLIDRNTKELNDKLAKSDLVTKDIIQKQLPKPAAASTVVDVSISSGIVVSSNPQEPLKVVCKNTEFCNLLLPKLLDQIKAQENFTSLDIAAKIQYIKVFLKVFKDNGLILSQNVAVALRKKVSATIFDNEVIPMQQLNNIWKLTNEDRKQAVLNLNFIFDECLNARCKISNEAEDFIGAIIDGFEYVDIKNNLPLTDEEKENVKLILIKVLSKANSNKEQVFQLFNSMTTRGLRFIFSEKCQALNEFVVDSLWQCCDKKHFGCLTDFNGAAVYEVYKVILNNQKMVNTLVQMCKKDIRLRVFMARLVLFGCIAKLDGSTDSKTCDLFTPEAKQAHIQYIKPSSDYTQLFDAIVNNRELCTEIVNVHFTADYGSVGDKFSLQRWLYEQLKGRINMLTKPKSDQLDIQIKNLNKIEQMMTIIGLILNGSLDAMCKNIKQWDSEKKYEMLRILMLERIFTKEQGETIKARFNLDPAKCTVNPWTANELAQMVGLNQKDEVKYNGFVNNIVTVFKLFGYELSRDVAINLSSVPDSISATQPLSAAPYLPNPASSAAQIATFGVIAGGGAKASQPSSGSLIASEGGMWLCL